jgi:hypothetical protein
MKNFANVLLNYTRDSLTSLLFLYEHRTSPTHFTRSSPLNFTNTTLLVLNLVKKAVKVELMKYFMNIDIAKTPSRQAFAEAREKVSYLAFKDLFDKSCELTEGNEGARLFNGYRLFAIDGTSFVVGQLEKLNSYFGKSTSVKDKAMCRIGGIVDVLNDCIVRATVSPFSVGERALAIEQVGQLKHISNALYLLDRGYWSPDLVSSIIKNNHKFVMRLASGSGRAIAKDEHGNNYNLRRHSFELPGGVTETLLTNIPEHEVSDDELARLYAKRWGIETKYLELKDRLQINKFSGETTNIVLQDIYSALYISNLTAFICFEADEIIKEEPSNSKYERKAKRSVCIAALRERFVKLCLLNDPNKRAATLEKLVNDIRSDVTYVGKSKSRPRIKKKFTSSRSNNVKQIL